MRLLALLLVSFVVTQPGLVVEQRAISRDHPGPLWSFSDERITESSGLVDFGDVMVTANDSGNDAIAFVLDSRDGRTVGETLLPQRLRDVEALAPAGQRAMWLGDIGDNARSRPSIAVYRVPIGRTDQVASTKSYEFAYPDGPHDAESMVVSRGRFYFITKSFEGGGVYRSDVPGPGVNKLTRVGSVSEYATDAALFGSGDRIIVRGYAAAGIYSFPGFDRLADVPLPAQMQGEGISVGPDDRIRISSEGVDSPVLAVAVPEPFLPVGAVAGVIAGS